MAVISAEVYRTGISGSASGEPDFPETEFTAVWIVKTDTPNDQARSIIEHFKNSPSCPYLGDGYAYGNDSDPTARLQKIAPRLSAESPTHWYVTLTYSPSEPGEQEKPGVGGVNTSNPLQWLDFVNISHQAIMVPAWRAKYLAPITDLGEVGIDGMEPNKMIIPQNSAGVPFSPGLEKRATIRVIRITKFASDYLAVVANLYLNKVNMDVVNIHKEPHGYLDTWEKRTALWVEFGGEWQVTNNVPHWRINIEIHHNPLSWVDVVPDIGMYRAVKPGDPDGKGGTISMTDILDGAPAVEKITDRFGRPLTEPVLLDGFGKPLSATATNPNWIRYLTYEETVMNDFNW